MSLTLPSYETVLAASVRLKGHAVVTPLLRSDRLDKISGCNLFVKAEPFQKGGAFKYRGARNRISQLSELSSKRGVVAFSSGNHAIGVAISANELGVSALIVMPDDAPKVKIDTVLSYGAEIKFYNRQTESREDIAQAIADNTGRTLVPSFDDIHIISGQGTIGIEIAQQCSNVNTVITGLGGGGLCAGISLALRKLCPATKVYGAEPTAYNDHQLSLESGYRMALKGTPPSICDALMTPIPGRLTWPINSQILEKIYTVSDEDCLKAMAVIKRELGLTIEPGGAAAIASVLRYRPFKSDERVVAIASGGNVDDEIMQRALQAY